MKVLTIKDIALIALLAAIVFVLEQLLSFLPNIQLTVFLIILFSKKIGFIKTTLIVTIHVLLDNLFMGSFNIYMLSFMYIGWMMIPITLTTLFKKVNSPISLALLSILYSFIYSWIMIIPSCILFELNFKEYIIADILFEIILASSSFISTLWLYKPCEKVLNILQEKVSC